MKNILNITMFTFGLMTIINAQGITNTLGGNTESNKFIIENSDSEVGLVVTGEGNVGIGTTEPGSGFNTKLDIVGSTSFRTNSGDPSKGIKIDVTGTSHRIYSDATSGTPYDLILGTYPNGHMNQLVLHQSSGNVGIGTTSPSQMLEVDGKIKIGTDGSTPTAGTIRFLNGHFQGYDGTTWKQLDN